MMVYVDFLYKLFLTEAALVWFLSSVGSLMIGKTTQGSTCKCLITQTALVWFLFRVSPYTTIQTIGLLS